MSGETVTSPSEADMALHEAVLNELVLCYGEGEDTDWPYLTDLASLIVDLIHRHGGSESGGPQGGADHG